MPSFDISDEDLVENEAVEAEDYLLERDHQLDLAILREMEKREEVSLPETEGTTDFP